MKVSGADGSSRSASQSVAVTAVPTPARKTRAQSHVPLVPSQIAGPKELLASDGVSERLCVCVSGVCK
jgi:hypothetical protein